MHRQPYKGCPFECNLPEITRNETFGACALTMWKESIIQMYHLRLKWERYMVCTIGGTFNFLEWAKDPTFSRGTPTFCQMGVLNACFQNPSEISASLWPELFTIYCAYFNWKHIGTILSLKLNLVICTVIQWFYLAIFEAVYGSHSQSKDGLYFPNFMYFSSYFPNFNKIFSQMCRKR